MTLSRKLRWIGKEAVEASNDHEIIIFGKLTELSCAEHREAHLNLRTERTFEWFSLAEGRSRIVLLDSSGRARMDSSPEKSGEEKSDVFIVPKRFLFPRRRYTC